MRPFKNKYTSMALKFSSTEEDGEEDCCWLLVEAMVAGYFFCFEDEDEDEDEMKICGRKQEIR